MADKRSEKCRYPSRYGLGRFVTAAQWLAELMCERQARKMGKTLPLQFWEDGAWKETLRLQVIAANRLLKRVDPQGTGTGARAVSMFLRGERGKNVYSLAGLWLVPFVEQCHRTVLALLEQTPAQSPAPADPEPDTPWTPFVPRPSILTLLEGL